VLARVAATRASVECATAVIRFRERTAAELLEFVVYLSSTEGDDGHQGRQSVYLRSCKQEKGDSGVGVRQGRDADTQGLTRRAVKRGQAGMHSRVTECWHVPPLKSNGEGLHRQSGRVKEETLTLKG